MRLTFCLVVAALVCGCTSSGETVALDTTKPGVATGLIWVAGAARARVLVTDEARGLAGAGTFWSPAEAKDLSPIQRTLFAGVITECKPAVYHGQRVLLVTAAPGGVAILRAIDAKVLLVAMAPKNAQSAELLPDGTLVSVSSNGGDTLRIYSTETGHTADYALAGATGVAWDKEGKLLWALGASALHRYAYNGKSGAPALKLISAVTLPTGIGRELYPRAWRDELFVTTEAGVWTYSPTDSLFAPFGPAADVKAVRSIGEKDLNGRILYTPGGSSLFFAHPQGTLASPATTVAKARWDRLPEFTYGYGGM
jgi:hypothetical protein